MSVSNVVRNYVKETTAHGLLHFTGDRPVYVKVLWIIAFLISLSYCTYKVVGAYRKFEQVDLSTTVKAGSENFMFPDVYFCNEHPISGSYPVTMSNEDYHVLRRYRGLVNDSLTLINASAFDSNTLTSMRIQATINTIPFQFLSDKMGHRKNQSIFQFEFQEIYKPPLRILHHPYFINCFGLNLTDNDIKYLQQPTTVMYIALFVDPELPPPFDNSTQQDLASNNNQTINLKPTDWDSNSGLKFSRPDGFRMYIVPRGEYPSERDIMMTVGPGEKHRFRLKMQRTTYKEPGQSAKCKFTGSDAAFLDPYSGEKILFKYSQIVCWYNELLRLSKEAFNCTPWNLPITWEYRDLQSCFNLSHFQLSFVQTEKFLKKRSEIFQNASSICAPQVSCETLSYIYQYSMSTWPSQSQWEKQYYGLLANLTNEDFLPGLAYLVSNGSYEQARKSLIQVELSTAEYKSDLIILSAAYSFDTLIADVGGLLGLFVGISLLSVMELLELLHDIVLALFKHKAEV